MFQQAFPELGSDRLLFIIKLVGIYHDKIENKRENCRRIFFLYRTGMSYESRKGEGGGGEEEAFSKILNSPRTRLRVKKSVNFPPKKRIGRGNLFVIRVIASQSHFP